MYLLLVFASYFSALCPCNDKGIREPMILNIDTLFINWNKATIKSLDDQISQTKDTTQKTQLINRLSALKYYVDIKRIEEVNATSIRYQLLAEIEKFNYGKSDFYVIESNRSGEKIDIISYVIYLNNPDTLNIYNFIKNKWVRHSAFLGNNLNLDTNLKNYFTKFGLGFNQDDVIISLLNDRNVLSSEFFLFATLADIANIKKILSFQ